MNPKGKSPIGETKKMFQREVYRERPYGVTITVIIHGNFRTFTI